MNALDSYWILYREPDEEAGVSYLGEFGTWDEAFSFRQATTPDEWSNMIEQEVLVSTTRLKAIVEAMDERVAIGSNRGISL